MALAVASSSAVITSSASSNTIPRSFTAGLKPATLVAQPKNATLASKTVSNGTRVNCMLVVDPVDNRHYETLSYLPQLSTEQLLKQVDYMIKKGLIPCIEFSKKGAVSRDHFRGSGYYDGRYWTMWKLPMFGCQDSAAVLREVEECRKAYPKFNIRIIGFDKVRQVQICGFVVQKGEVF